MAFIPPGGYPPIPMPPPGWSRRTKRNGNRRPRSWVTAETGKTSKNGPFYFAAHKKVCYSPHPDPPRPGPHPSEPDRNCHPSADPAPRSIPGHEPPPRGPKPQNRQEGPRSYQFFGIQTAGRQPPHPDAPTRLVPSDETEPQSEAPIMNYGRNRQNLQKRTILLCGPRGRLL